MGFSARPSMFTSRPMRLSGATSGASRGRRSCSRRLRRLLERRRGERFQHLPDGERALGDRKSTRLNSSHLGISYAVFCLKKKKKNKTTHEQTTTHKI